jgi:hypothetical protein
MRLSTILLLALVMYPSVGVSQQLGPSTVAISGAVSSSVMISLPFGKGDVLIEKGGLDCSTRSSGQDRIIVRLQSANPSSISSAELRIWIRTNTAYKIEASLLADDPEWTVTLSTVGARPTGPGVVASALDGFGPVAARTRITARSQEIATGARISRGAISSPYNAIELVLNVDAEQRSASAKPVEILLRIRPA